MPRRWRGTVAVTLAITVVGAGIVGGLATNSASGRAHWPGVLDLIRQYPWPAVGVVAGLGILASLGQLALSRPQDIAIDPALPPVPVLPAQIVGREQSEAVIAALRSRRRSKAVGITTGVYGAGGFGKTTIAQMVCADRRVQQYFNGRIYMFSIGRDSRSPAAITAKIAEVTRFITKDETPFVSPDVAGAHLGRLLDQRPRTLLVLDDVWAPEQLAPFLLGGGQCVRLVATRVPEILPREARQIKVDEMSAAQARRLLSWELPGLPKIAIDRLLTASGRWPLLLRLMRSQIDRLVATGAEAASAADEVLAKLRLRGAVALDDPTAVLDLNNQEQRNRAVKASVEAALEMLPPGGRDRFIELGIFAQDQEVPVVVIWLLWRASGRLTETETRELCYSLSQLSLIALNPADGGLVRIHDLLRDYLRGLLKPDGLTRLNATFVDSVADTVSPAGPLIASAPDPGFTWWELTEGYLLDHLVEHVLAAGHADKAEAIARDLRWVIVRLQEHGPTAPWNDLARIPSSTASARAGDLARAAHLLAPTVPAHAQAAILLSRLHGLPAWHDQVAALDRGRIATPVLLSTWPPPDLPAPVVKRALAGHEGPVNTVAVSPDGTWLATGGHDQTVQIWDPVSGAVTGMFRVSGSVAALAISPDGAFLAVGSTIGDIQIFDKSAEAVAYHLSLGDIGLYDISAIAFTPDGTQLAAACNERVLPSDKDEPSRTVGVIQVWNLVSAATLAKIVQGKQVSADYEQDAPPDLLPISKKSSLLGSKPGALLALLAWLARAGIHYFDRRIRSWTKIAGPYANPAADIPPSSRGGRMLAPIRKLFAYAVRELIPFRNEVAVTFGFVDGASDKSVPSSGGERISVAAATPIATLDGHTGVISAIAISPDGTWLASGGEDLVVWDRVGGVITATMTGHDSQVNAVAISPDSSWVASASDDRTVRIWDRTGGRNTGIVDLSCKVRAVAISPDGMWMSAAGDDMKVLTWKAADISGSVPAVLTGHNGRVNAVAIAPDGSWLASASDDGTIRIWDQDSHADEYTGPPASRQVGLSAVAYSADGTELLAGTDGGFVQIWDRASGVITVTLPGHQVAVTAIEVSPAGKHLAIGNINGSVLIQDWPISKTDPKRLDLTYYGKVLSVNLSENGEIRMIGQQESVYIRDFESQLSIRAGASYPGWHLVAFSPDGKWFVTARPALVQIWEQAVILEASPVGREDATPSASAARYIQVDDQDGVRSVRADPLATINVGSGDITDEIVEKVLALAISPDGARLAIGREDTTILIWDRATASVTATLTGHSRPVTGLAFSPDGRWLASVSKDGSVLIWTAETLQIATLSRTDSALSSCVWALDSAGLALIGETGIHLYEFRP